MNAGLLLLHCWIGTFTQVKTLKTPFWIGFVFDSIESPVKRKMCLFVICWPLLLRWPSKMAYTHLSVVLKPETTGMFECFFCYTCWVIECFKGSRRQKILFITNTNTLKMKRRLVRSLTPSTSTNGRRGREWHNQHPLFFWNITLLHVW